MRAATLHGLLLLGAAATLAAPTSASVLGTDFGVRLEGEVVDGTSTGTEGHATTARFDGLVSALPNDLSPLPPLAPGNDLWVGESVTPDGPRDEIVTITLFGGDGTGSPPAAGSHGALFANPLDPLYAVVFDVTGLHTGIGAAEVSGISVSAGSAGGLGPLSPVDFELFWLSGAGNALDPIDLLLDLDPLDLTGATDLVLELTVTTIPEPGPFGMVAVGLLWLARSRRQSRSRR